MKQLTQQQAIDFLMNEVGILLDITTKGFYYLVEHDNYTTLCWKPEKLTLDGDFVSIGIEIARHGHKHTTLLPAIMTLLKGYEVITITSIDLQQTVTKAKEITMQIFEEYDTETVVLEYEGIPIAVGTVMSGIFYPTIDVGWFLREGK